jgi:EF hand
VQLPTISWQTASSWCGRVYTQFLPAVGTPCSNSTCCSSGAADCPLTTLQAEMRDLFNAIDTDGSGTITHEEMMEVGHACRLTRIDVLANHISTTKSALQTQQRTAACCRP